MSTFKKVLAAGFAVAFVAGTVSAQIIWDNNVVSNGSSGRALSPPSFPNIRVADDVIFQSATSWTGINAEIIEDAGWVSSGLMTVDLWSDNAGAPGALVDTRSVSVTRTVVGNWFGRVSYLYAIDLSGNPLNVAAGTFWVVLRDPGGSGAGTNYWMTSDGGPDGAGSSTGFFSLDAGGSWSPEGAIWHHAFNIEAIPAPGALALLGLGGLVGSRRRRR